MDQNEVLFEEISGAGGDLGVITLNRPKVLNSLNHDMVNAMYAQLQTWAVADNVKGVVIRAAEGKAFCAGGDLRLTYDRIKAHDPIMAEFFRDEYQLNRFIFHFPKPYIALLDGITMGGGVGISIHGSHCVATERLLFAMPETGIGFFPDVGGTYFLPRLPGKIGFYLGLTGARINSDDCVAIGITQTKVASESLPNLVQALAQESFGANPKIKVTDIINQFKVTANPSTLLASQKDIEKYFNATTMESLLENLQQSSDAFCKATIDSLLKKSPTSLKVSLQAMFKGQQLDFDSCMRQEYRLTYHFIQGHDFAEGIRAVIIHKDQTPQWDPPTLDQITNQELENYFAPVAKELA